MTMDGRDYRSKPPTVPIHDQISRLLSLLATVPHAFFSLNCCVFCRRRGIQRRSFPRGISRSLELIPRPARYPVGVGHGRRWRSCIARSLMEFSFRCAPLAGSGRCSPRRGCLPSALCRVLVVVLFGLLGRAEPVGLAWRCSPRESDSSVLAARWTGVLPLRLPPGLRLLPGALPCWPDNEKSTAVRP